jgi:hypothetical protein
VVKGLEPSQTRRSEQKSSSVLSDIWRARSSLCGDVGVFALRTSIWRAANLQKPHQATEKWHCVLPALWPMFCSTDHSRELSGLGGRAHRHGAPMLHGRAIDGRLYLLPEHRPANFEQIDQTGPREAAYGPEDVGWVTPYAGRETAFRQVVMAFQETVTVFR